MRNENTWCWSAVWCCNGATNLWTIEIKSFYMLWSQYKLVMIRRTEFLRKEIIGIPNIANRNSNFLTLQTSEFQKKIQLESLESKTELEFCLWWGSQKSEPKIGVPNQVEKLRGLRYKVRMMGVPLTGPSYMYGDNKSQVTNSTRPKSTLKKNCNSICYHAVQESAVMQESLITHIPMDKNLSDLMTKVTHSIKRRRLVGGILYDIYDDHHDWQSRPAYC